VRLNDIAAVTEAAQQTFETVDTSRMMARLHDSEVLEAIAAASQTAAVVTASANANIYAVRGLHCGCSGGCPCGCADSDRYGRVKSIMQAVITDPTALIQNLSAETYHELIGVESYADIWPADGPVE